VSALCGAVHLDGRPAREGELDGVVNALSSLGPDGGGIWSGTVGRCPAVLWAGLRHSTPEDAGDRQPAESQGGSVVLVGDLRVDNRADLAASLGLRDELSVPDSAFVLAAYERWGKAMPEHLVGEFALAIADSAEGGVLLARDHLGSRPLVVHEGGGIVAFASNALSLTAFPGVGHDLDMTHAAEMLALLASSTRTFVRGVRWLPPGEALWIASSGTRQWAWWRPDWDAIDTDASPAQVEQALRAALDSAVGAQLRSRGGIGAMTSGGLDSPSVTATAAELVAPEPLPTYTSAPPPGWVAAYRDGWDPDDTPLVRKLAERHRNLRPSFIHVPREAALFSSHEEVWELGGGPVRYAMNWLWLREIRRRSRADGVSALLTGMRGNMFFSADAPRWLVSLARSGRPVAVWREAGAWSRATRLGRWRTLRRHLVWELVPGRVQDIRLGLTGRARPLQVYADSTGLRGDVLAGIDAPRRIPGLAGPRGRDGRALSRAVVHHLAEQAATEAARTSLTGVEERDPTGDRRLVETALRQPDWLRRRNGRTRAVVRGAMADRLPPEIVGRTTYGWQFPDWLEVMTARRHEVESELELCRQHSASRELIDTQRLRHMVDDWPEPRRAGDPAVHRHYLGLARTLLASKYLRWFEARGARFGAR
jgi:asparagine synthase (glutamine-hydrolysing)